MVKELKGFSCRELDQERKARRFCHKLVAPSSAQFKALLRQKLVQNFAFQGKEVELAQKIFGPDVSTLKGKSNIPRPWKIMDHKIEIPAEFFEHVDNYLELAIDIVYINTQTYLTAIDRSINFKATVPIVTQKQDEVFKDLNAVLCHCNDLVYKIMWIHA